MTYVKPEALEALERRLLDVHERRQVRKSMAAWARHKGFEPAAHHLLIMRELKQFIASDDYTVAHFESDRVAEFD